MKKKKKLNLSSLEVKSFVTSMEETEESTAKGGQPVVMPVLTRPPCFIVTLAVRCQSLFLCPTQEPQGCPTMPSGCAGPCTGPPSFPPCTGPTAIICFKG